VDPIAGGRPSENDGDAIFARSFGDEKDPNETATDEGTRFFVQLLTGLNTGAAVDSSLEILAGRSGSAASLTGVSTTVTGLTGCTTQDIGRYLTVWNLAADEADHRLITAYNSTTSLDVAGANFTADASGAVNWEISRHPGDWDFYNGDRYRNDELSETAGRTTLIGGIVSDAELTQDIAEIREFIGAADGDTAPTLTNTGNFFPFSDIPDPNDSELEEVVNILNQEIGNRDYSAAAVAAGLTDGETITASLEALALAIGTSSVSRTIERLTVAASKNVSHLLPGGITYTLDGTDNGKNMFVFWRGILRDPGTLATGDDYAETDTTHITPYSNINANDHINYLILQ
jgi:hypothetical protein